VDGRCRFLRSAPAAAGAALLIATLGVHAAPFDRIDVEAGTGNHVDVLALGIGTRDLFDHSLGDHSKVSAYLLGRVAYWGSLDDHPMVAAVYDFSVTPVLRIETTATKFPFFVDLGVGLHALTHTRINVDRTFGSAIQFGEFLGPGIRFGDAGQYEFSARVQHVSNGGIRDPNDGLTYGSVVFRYNFH